MIRIVVSEVLLAFDGSSSREQPECPGFDFVKLGSDALDDPIFAENDRRKRFQERLSQSHTIHGLTQAGRVAAYFWLSRGSEVPFSAGINVAIPPDTGYIWDCRTAAAFQRRGLYTFGLTRMIGYCRSKGSNRIIIASEKANSASLAGIAKAGFAYSHAWHTFRLGPLKFAKRTGGEWSFVKGQRPIPL